jgi:hypothetical protein
MADIGGQTWTQITAGYHMPHGPFARMSQAVHGGENWPPETADTSGLNTPEETSTKMLVSSSFTAMTRSTAEETARLQFGDDW